MFVTFEQLSALGIIINVTRDGKLEVDCSTISVISAQYSGNNYYCNRKTKMITITLLPQHKDTAIELLREQDIGFVIEVNPERSLNEHIKAMTGLSSAPKCDASTMPLRHAPVATMNCNGTITATVCVSSYRKDCFVNLASNVITMGRAYRGDITVHPTDVTDQCEGYYSLKLQDGSVLLFTFYNDIAPQATGLLQKARDAADAEQGRATVAKTLQKGLDAMKRDSRSRAIASASRVEPSASTHERVYSAFDDRLVISPVSIPTRKEEVNALSGAFDAVLTREDQKAQQETEEANRLEQQRQKAEADEAKRLQDLADIACVEKQREEAEARAQQDNANRNALVAEFKSFDPVALIAVGKPTLDEFLANPQELRDEIANVMYGTAQACGSMGEGEEAAPSHEQFVIIHTPHESHILGLRAQAAIDGIKIDVYQTGKHWSAKISANDMQRIGVFLRNQYIWVSAKPGGYSVQVSAKSYNALAQIRLDTATHVIEAQAMQKQYSHKAQWLLPVPEPMHIIPVYNKQGCVVAYQEIPLFAHQQVPTFAHQQVPTFAHQQAPTFAHQQVPQFA
jgi:hypothetical protein